MYPACRRILLDLTVRGGATLANLAAGDLHPSLPPAEAFTAIHAFQVPLLCCLASLCASPPRLQPITRRKTEPANPCIVFSSFSTDTKQAALHSAHHQQVSTGLAAACCARARLDSCTQLKLPITEHCPLRLASVCPIGCGAVTRCAQAAGRPCEAAGPGADFGAAPGGRGRAGQRHSRRQHRRPQQVSCIHT
jgi:hypothetical protein